MIDFLKDLDKRWLLIVNQTHTPWLDQVMWFFSNRYVWIPLYAIPVIIIVLQLKKKAIPHLIILGLLIVLSDQLASSVMKPLFQRLRPSHDPSIEDILHYVNHYKGGLYGFVSSHSMNVFALSFYFLFATPGKIRWLSLLLFLWAMIVAYSRVYLGVHYPADVIIPIFISCALAYCASKIYRPYSVKYSDANTNEIIQP